MSMTPTAPASAPTARRARGDEGVALVEFAFVFILFFALMFGIIAFGVLLSFQQTMTQGANEAARAAAVTTDNPSTAEDERIEAAEDAVLRFNSWNRPCLDGALNGTNGMTCTIQKHDCGATTFNPATLPDCITVTLVYDYQTHPLLPDFPFIGGAIPNTITATATAQISDFDPTTPTTPPTSPPTTSTTLPDPCAITTTSSLLDPSSTLPDPCAVTTTTSTTSTTSTTLAVPTTPTL